MAAAPTQSSSNAIPQDTLITIKVSVNDSLKKLKLPLRDLGANVLPDKLRHLLGIKPEQTVIFERFSDSAGGYITLDPNNPQVFKTLIRAAKAKLKLRLKATVTPVPEKQSTPISIEEEKTSQKIMEPVIVRTPVTNPRDSTAFDGRSVGSGIFQFKEARATQQPLIDTSEAPVPRPFSTNSKFAKDFHKDVRSELAFRCKEPTTTVESHGHAWSVYCNNCDHAVTDEHFHCSICDGGDYDLCPDCVASGHLCPGEGHWLIKRFVENGEVINSKTERISPRKIKEEELEIKKEIPGAFTDETKTLADVPQFATRTCNSCVVVLPDREFVTCTSCEDFDLCIRCHSSNKHGHHPAHGFKPATDETILPLTAETMLAPGRNVRHNAICDSCDKKIYGIRHKCLDCPDWDYCNDCHKNAQRTHPRHRFTAIYSPIGDAQPVTTRHFGIYCDGPLCSKRGEQSYITGVRYKCAVCNDTDFCASCEALPTNSHNRTHPLIKFKTPVRGVSISTENEDPNGRVRMMGDRRPAPVVPQTRTASTETTPVAQTNAATQVQTMAEIKPSEEKNTVVAEKTIPATLLNARFVQDSIADGTVFAPGSRFTQVFTMRNEGPYPWPAGCSVRHVGGDNMLNVDNSRPASVSDIREATESNVIGRDVAVGEEIAFKITLKAPTREGKHISYWRMKSADGTPFGHRLWVDIEVKKPASPVADAQPAQPMPIPGVMQQHYQHEQSLQQQRMLQAMMRQQQMRLQEQQQMRAQAAAQQQAQGSTLPPPPAYDTLPNGANISARIAAMREQQSKRREQLMAQFNANRDQLQAQGINRGDMPSWHQHFNPTIGSGVESSSPQPTEEDKARKDAARQRVEHIKAKILRAREEKAKAAEAKKKSAAEETEKVKKILEEVVKTNEAEKEAEAKKLESLEGSQMVFPKLDKESPASSTYQFVASTAGSKGKAAYVENEDGEVERSATPSEAPAPAPLMESPKVEKKEEFEDLEDEDFEDIEVLSADGEDSASEDDGFLTDEEYDILDASDHETVASP